jgi:hypothetical protein
VFEENDALAPEAASEDDEDGARLERLTEFGWVDSLASLWNRESECALRKTRSRCDNSMHVLSWALSYPLQDTSVKLVRSCVALFWASLGTVQVSLTVPHVEFQ